MSGFIKLHRAVRGTAIAQHPEYFAAWVHLLCMASHKPHDQIVGKKVITLEPGQLVFGRQKFSATTGISENKVRAALDVMKQLGMITSKSHAKFSVITITNWLKYQHESPAENQQRTSNAPATHHKQEGSKKGEEGSKKHIPPKSPKGESMDYSSWPEMPDPQILKDWIAARKKAKGTHSQTVINRIGKELHKAVAMGYTVDDCLSLAVVKCWRGFEASWMANANAQQPQSQPRQPKDFPFGG